MLSRRGHLRTRPTGQALNRLGERVRLRLQPGHVAPAAAACASSRARTVASLRPRTGADTDIRLILAGPAPARMTAPQPTGSPCSEATSSRPAGGQLRVVHGHGLRRVVPGLEADGQLAGVGPLAGQRARRSGIGPGQLDGRRRQQPFDLSHRGDQPVPLAAGERAEDGARRVVGEPVQFRPLGLAGAGQLRYPDPPIGLARRHRDQAIAGQAAQ